MIANQSFVNTNDFSTIIPDYCNTNSMVDYSGPNEEPTLTLSDAKIDTTMILSKSGRKPSYKFDLRSKSHYRTMISYQLNQFLSDIFRKLQKDEVDAPSPRKASMPAVSPRSAASTPPPTLTPHLPSPTSPSSLPSSSGSMVTPAAQTQPQADGPSEG